MNAAGLWKNLGTKQKKLLTKNVKRDNSFNYKGQKVNFKYENRVDNKKCFTVVLLNSITVVPLYNKIKY